MDMTLKFTDSHEWVKDNGDGTATIGISDHAQKMLGDVVFVDLPEVDAEIEAGEEFSLVESVKAASDVYAPVSGQIIEVNEELEDSPELVNEEPYDGGWIAKVKLSNASELDNLKGAEDYINTIEEDE
ncbi:glycine cleavage system protein GcvH [Vibrio albus]|uniref:Glycine cleavage system H protein n=1 Tax=Vibrio albus TaxID=2200953 RepID=A0A2U3B9C6_9VIBR|nr:glycine cleavage system protein GcvH [Vibrio albus]PWI33345.1 glycine cleavage system protein GcvH [Vibrio albus]